MLVPEAGPCSSTQGRSHPLIAVMGKRLHSQVPRHEIGDTLAQHKAKQNNVNTADGLGAQQHALKLSHLSLLPRVRPGPQKRREGAVAVVASSAYIPSISLESECSISRGSRHAGRRPNPRQQRVARRSPHGTVVARAKG